MPKTKYRTYIRKWGNLSEEHRKLIYNTLTFHTGMMRIWIKSSRAAEMDIVLAISKGKPIGWAAISGNQAGFFVRRSYRRRGIGRRLFKRLAEIRSHFTCHPHDKVSTTFFDTVSK